MKTRSVLIKNVSVQGGFWGSLVDMVREIILPFQWEVMNDRVPGAAKSGVIENFKIAAGRAKGEFHGYVFQDSDFGKWSEAVAYSLMTHPDPRLKKKCDQVIDLLEKAQEKDGYLNTRFMLKDRDKRWTNLRDWHEMYVAGHLLEGAVACYYATGERKFLDVMIKNIDLIASLFGPQKSQKRGYPGHQEIELALVKLYRVSGEKKYLDLAKFFIDERGQQPFYFDIEHPEPRTGYYGWTALDFKKYNQSHLPVREQKVATGHAVRAMYMYCGMTDIAIETGDKTLISALKRLWQNVTEKQMYVTGAVGSSGIGEAFSYDYNLPNETAYAETCANIGLVFWAHRMLQLDVDSVYADVMERALYNGVISGVALDGKHFFYQNPLASYPNPDGEKGATQRAKWFGCACCPPNLARLLMSLGTYIYSQTEKEIYTHLFVSGTADIELKHTRVQLIQKTDYPWKDRVVITVNPSVPTGFTLAVRLPNWCRKPVVNINGKAISLKNNRVKGYAKINRMWQKGDTIELKLPMPVERVYSHSKVRTNAGRVALQRGPIVYCLEEVDNGKDLNAIFLPKAERLVVKTESIAKKRIPVIHAKAVRIQAHPKYGLYTNIPPRSKEVSITAIPYFMWANRKEGEMIIWMNGIWIHLSNL